MYLPCVDDLDFQNSVSQEGVTLIGPQEELEEPQIGIIYLNTVSLLCTQLHGTMYGY